MSHVYASLQDAKNYALDGGQPWGAGSTNDDLALSILESVSRRIDGWCRRSDFGSGFGPRIGTNRYDGPGKTTLNFNDDLIETTDDIVVRASTGSSSVANPAADTDFYAVDQFGTYDSLPLRRALLHGQGSQVRWPTGWRVIDWPGIWGYESVTVPVTGVLDDAIDADDTTVVLDDFAGVSPGQTLLVDDEQIYVREFALTDGDPVALTVVRGVNGTTAASHLDEAAVARYVYDARVVEATKRLWLKRWGERFANADATEGGGQVSVTPFRKSENTILLETVAGLRLMGHVVFG